MNFDFEFISAKEFDSFFYHIRYEIFENDFDFNVNSIMSLEEKEKIKELYGNTANLFSYHLVAKHNGAIVAWSFGIQKSQVDVYMINSAVLPEYRRKGVYSKMLDMTVGFLKEKGFQHLYSRHKMANNAIIIPKLKYGFVISGFDINDSFGPTVILSYYTNPRRKELLEIRMGTRKPTEEDLKLIK